MDADGNTDGTQDHPASGTGEILKCWSVNT